MTTEAMLRLAGFTRNVSRATPEDRPAIRIFQREMFGENSNQLDEERYEWLFERNPYRRADNLHLWICKPHGQVVGQQGGIPFELKVQTGYHQASWAIDLMVHPRWRLRGVGPALWETHIQSNYITLSLGVSDLAYGAYLRAGWIDMGVIPLYVRPLDVREMLRGRRVDNPLAVFGGKAIQPLIRLADAGWDAYARCSRTRLVRIDQFDQRADGLWREANQHYPIIARRDYRSLRWRFDEAPDRDRYKRYYLMQGRDLRGYAVLRLGERHGAAAGFFVDFLSEPQWTQPLLAGCLRYFRRCGLAAAYYSAQNQSGQPFLRRLGFMRRSSEQRFMVRVDKGDGRLTDVLSDLNNWFITMGDSDADRP